MGNSECFFMVYVENESAPTYKHTTLLSAETEAKRLCKLTGKRSFVLCSIKSLELNEFNVSDCRPSMDDLPF